MFEPNDKAGSGEDPMLRIIQMEEIYERIQQKANALEQAISEYEELQSEIEKLEVYYTSQDWKNDFAMEERGEIPQGMQRGILSEDGIYNLLEQNKELMKRLEEKNE